MAYVSKRFVGGTITVQAGALGGNPVVDSYTIEKDFEGVIYRWTGVRVSYIDNDGNMNIHLPDQEWHSDGGPYVVECGTPLAWKNP
jgi:hypothetical protein